MPDKSSPNDFSCFIQHVLNLISFIVVDISFWQTLFFKFILARTNLKGITVKFLLGFKAFTLTTKMFGLIIW